MAMSRQVAAMVENGDLWRFYRGVYKSTGCGPMVGFRIDGEWVYGSDLPREVGPGVVVDGISVSSIVEGSDVEVEGVKFTGDEWTPEQFWEAVESVNEEASFYWDRDNTTWMNVTRKGEDKPSAWLHWTEWDEDMVWDDRGPLSEKECARVEDVVRWVMDGGDFPARTRDGMVVDTWENDCTY